MMRPDTPTRGLPIASPANMLPVQVIRREEIAHDVVSVFIVLPGTDQAPAPYLPGQFVTLALPTPRETLYRSYSLCGDGDARHPWELTIKRVEMGAVSSYFYKSVVEGTLLYASLPRGTFTLPAGLQPDQPLIFCAVGSGITPIMGMLRAIARMHPSERPLAQLHYASRSSRDIIFDDELASLDPDQYWLRQAHYLSADGNRMTAEVILARAGKLATRAHWYICGPDALKHDMQEGLRQARVRPEQIHAEVFATQAPGPAYKLDHRLTGDTPAALTVAETGATLDVKPGETLLAALERHGYHPDYSCRVGACGACKLKLLDGQVDPVGEALSRDDRDAGYVLGCIARPLGAVTLASGGRPPAGIARIAPELASPARRPSSSVTLVRMASLLGVGALVMGAWNLTNHRPLSWDTASAAPLPTQSVPAAGASATVAPGGVRPGGASTPTGGGGGTGPGAAPTVNPAPGSPPPAAPTATPRPKPAPTATSTPSPKR
jgi:3-ketosteroid 9alpha-monooxygenase subunit B